jgi:Ca2+-binding EF-hand superfamily protein
MDGGLPDLYKHPRQWFQYFDADRNGYLDRQECTIALAATFPFLTEDHLDSILETIWRRYDPNNTNVISVEQFIRKGGMCDMLQITFPSQSASPPQVVPGRDQSYSPSHGSSPEYRQRQQVNSYGHVPPGPEIRQHQNINVPGNRQYFVPSSQSASNPPSLSPVQSAPPVGPSPPRTAGSGPREQPPDYSNPYGSSGPALPNSPGQQAPQQVQQQAPQQPGRGTRQFGDPVSAPQNPRVVPSQPQLNQLPQYSTQGRQQQPQNVAGAVPAPAQGRQPQPPSYQDVSPVRQQPSNSQPANLGARSQPPAYNSVAVPPVMVIRQEMSQSQQDSGRNGLSSSRSPPPPAYNEVKRNNNVLSSNSSDLYSTKQFQAASMDSEVGTARSRSQYSSRSVESHGPGSSRQQARPQQQLDECPVNIFENPRLWFQFFDKNHNGYLEKQECDYAFACTFRDMEPSTIQAVIDGLWDDFVNPRTRQLSADDFVKPHGLCDMILSSLPNIQKPKPTVSSRSEESNQASARQQRKTVAPLSTDECPVSIFDNSRLWFQYFDKDHNGYLDKRECEHAFACTFKDMDPATITGILEGLWEDFVNPRTRQLSVEDFVRPNGLCDMILSSLPKAQSSVQKQASASSPRASAAPKQSSRTPPQQTEECPVDIFENPRLWFQFFDRNHNGNLEKQECEHAFACTFKDMDRDTIKGIIEGLWDDFVNAQTHQISVDDFVKPHGLCDMILTSFPNSRKRSTANSGATSSGPVVVPPATNSSPRAGNRQSPRSGGAFFSDKSCPYDISTDPEAWFRYFDADHNGSLDKTECEKAFVTTFPDMDVGSIKELIGGMWDEFVNPATHKLEVKDFTRSGGMCELILQQLGRPTPSNRSPATSKANSSPRANTAPSRSVDSTPPTETVVERKQEARVTCPYDIYENPRQWFQFFDADGSGTLDMEECCEALQATFTELEPAVIEGMLEDMWEDFVNPETQLMNADDFVKDDGLCDTILQQLPRPTPKASKAAGKNASPVVPVRPNPNIQARDVPDIFVSPRQWFQHFDKDDSGTLDKDELQHAFEDTFPESDSGMIDAMIEDMWDGFVNPKTKLLSIDDFVRDDGLCDTILEQMGKKTHRPNTSPVKRPTGKPAAKGSPASNILGYLGMGKATGRRKALFVGANYYGTEGILQSSVHDCQIMKTLLTDVFEWELKQDVNMKILRDNTTNMKIRPNRKNIVDGLSWLVDGAKKGDVLFFHYSGHSAQIFDNKLGRTVECIVPGIVNVNFMTVVVL